MQTGEVIYQQKTSIILLFLGHFVPFLLSYPDKQIQEGSEPARGQGGRQREGEKYWRPAQQHHITY